MATHAWIIKEKNAGERLDLFLVSELGDVSRSAIQKQIREGIFLVNGNIATVHRFLKKGDKITEKKPSVGADLVPGLHKTTARVAPTSKLNILEETKEWMVIDKPIGLLVHPDAKTKTGTLIDLLLAHDPKIAKVGGHPERPGIVHRLDREVSGLMVVAKTEQAFESLTKQFAGRTAKKTYFALVHGEMPSEEGDIKFRIARSASKARMAARPAQETGGRAAWTHYKVKQRFRGATLIELDIFSGRTHQIRAHLFALGHPVMGDTLYALRRTDRNIHAPRLFLQSIGLTFTDPKTGEQKEFHLKPDPSFQRLTSSF